MKKRVCLLLVALTLVWLTGCSEQNQELPNTKQAIQVPKPTEPQVLDVTLAYKHIPYSDTFAQARKEELDSLNDLTLFNISSSKTLPQFYKGFYQDIGKYNVTLDQYAYDLTFEDIKGYFDTWERSRFINWSTTKVIDTFVVEDKENDLYVYYCYYTATLLGDNGSNNLVTYYRDAASVDKQTLKITAVQDYVLKENLTVPKSISGENDFSDVI